MSLEENKVQGGTPMRSSRLMIFTLVMVISCARQTAAQSEDRRNFLFKQCDEHALGFRADPQPFQEFVGPEFTLALEDGKARIAIIIQDCSQYWVDGINLGDNRHAHVWVQLEGPQDVQPVVGAERTLPTMTWFSLSAGSTNARDFDARKKSGTSPTLIDEIVLNLSGTEQGGSVTFAEELSYSWTVSSELTDGGLAAEISSVRLLGVNHIVYVRDSSGELVIKRIQALCNVAPSPKKGILNVLGGTDPGRLISSGTYPVLVYTFLPLWARVNLGEEPSNTAENNQATILKYIEEMNRGNEDYLDEYFDPDVIFHGATGDMDIDQFKAFHHQVLTAFPGAVMKAEDIMVSGDKAITRWRMTGNHQGPFLGIQPTGKDIAVTGILISRFKNGKVVEEWEEANIAGLMQQLATIEDPAKE
jgi:predicted ester cyclase